LCRGRERERREELTRGRRGKTEPVPRRAKRKKGVQGRAGVISSRTLHRVMPRKPREIKSGKGRMGKRVHSLLAVVGRMERILDSETRKNVPAQQV